jgi:hypothetical protein
MSADNDTIVTSLSDGIHVLRAASAAEIEAAEKAERKTP